MPGNAQGKADLSEMWRRPQSKFLNKLELNPGVGGDVDISQQTTHPVRNCSLIKSFWESDHIIIAEGLGYSIAVTRISLYLGYMDSS